jgi:hypothetical protein
MKKLIVAILGILLSVPVGFFPSKTIEHSSQAASVTQVSTMTHKKCPSLIKWICKLTV